MTFFYKIVKILPFKYLQTCLLAQALNQIVTRSAKKNLLTTLSSGILSFSNTFFTYWNNEWKKLNDNLSNANSIYKFTKFIKVKESPTFLYLFPSA